MSRKTFYAFVTSFVLLITVIVLNRITFQKMQRFTSLVNHTREVITTFESLSDDFKSAQIYTTTYQADSLKKFYTLYKQNADQIAGELSNLKHLVRDNPSQSLRVDTIKAAIEKQLPILMQKNIAEIISMGQGWRLAELFQIHDMINRGAQEEQGLLNDRTGELNNFSRLNKLLSISFGILAVGIFIFTFLNNLLISRKSKWLEGFLESILNTSQNGIGHFKAIREQGKIVDFRIEFLNNSIDDLLGLRSKSLLRKRVSQASNNAIDPSLVNRFIEVVNTSKAVEFEMLYKGDLSERWLLVSLAKLDDGVTASFHDISQLKKIETELQSKIKDLERSNTELEQYAYVASHDLQEPLRKIRSFGSYLQDTQLEKLDERGKQLLDKIMKSADRMSSLIKDVLSFSSLKRQTEFAPVDLNRVIDNVVSDLDLLITQKHATIEVDRLPTVEAIPLQMTQLFYNLINNSLKFAKEGESSQIKICCRTVPDNERRSSFVKAARYYEIIASDNGIGFSMDHSEQIFGLFKRLNNKQFYSGSGIGLSLCRKVVENHGGEIYAEGQENRGARFIIYLPERQD
ncbi:MAG: ATP-binding protein [Flavisolibacter sp.]